jgi:hypothetical protein
VLDKLLAHSPNRRGADFQRLTDVFICPVWSRWTRIGFEQDARVKQFSGCCLPCGKHLVEVGALFCGQSDNILLIHVFPLELVQ